MALLSWIWKLETSFVKNSNHLQCSFHPFHVQTDDSRVIHCFENGWSSDSHEYLRHLGKGQNVSRGHNILIFLIKRSKDFFLFCVTTWLGKKAKMCLWYKVIKVDIVLGLLSDMPWNLSMLKMNWKLDVSNWWTLID